MKPNPGAERGADPIDVALQYAAVDDTAAPNATADDTAAADDTGNGVAGGDAAFEDVSGSPAPENGTARDGAPTVTLAREQARARTEWVEAGRVRLRRRVITERRTIQVDVRREVVEISGETVDYRGGRLVGTNLAGPAVEAPSERDSRLIAVLREEVPVVTMAVRPYEQLILSTQLVAGAATVRTTLSHEEAQLDVESAPNFDVSPDSEVSPDFDVSPDRGVTE